MTDTTVADLPVVQEQAVADVAKTSDARPSLDDILSKALDDAEAPPDKGKGDPPDGTQETDNDGRPRDERGRFASKTAAPEASATGATEGAQTVVTANAQGPASVQQPDPHARWDDARKAKFSTLPAEAKQFALDVQAEHEANFTRKSQELSAYRQAADPLLSAVQPFQQYLSQVGSQLGSHPASLVGELLRTEYTLRTGTPEQKVQALGQIVQSYGIDLAHFIGGPSAQNPGQAGAPQFDPAILNLRQTNVRLENELRGIRTEIDQQKRVAEAAEEQQTISAIDTFKSEKTADGQPKYPHFDRVRGVMSQVLLSKKASNLPEAYAIAIAPINEAVAAELANRQKTADVERQAAVEKARKAAPVKSATGSLPNGAAKGVSLDSILSANLSKAGYA